MDSILTSAKNIASGNLSDDKLLKEELNISTKTISLVDNISKLGGDPKAGFITPMGSATVSLTTNVINAFAGGLNDSAITSIISSGSTLFTESIKLFGSNEKLKNSKFGQWLATKAAGQKVATFAKDYLGHTVSAILGVYSAISTYLDSNEQYNIDGLPTSDAIIDKTIDVVADIVHSFSNAFMSATVGIDADTVFKGVNALATTIKYNLQTGWARITGGDVSKIKYQTTNKNFTEIIADTLKSLITGTTGASDIFNEENNKKINTIKGKQTITNCGSYCTINAGAGDDVVLNDSNTQSNYIDGGNDKDIIVIYGPSNTARGGQGNDTISLYSNGKTPAGGNKIFCDTGNDVIYVDDSRCSTLPRRSNNTIIGGEGNDTIALFNTNIPVVLRYSLGDDNDTVFGYESNDTLQIINSEYSTSNNGENVIVTVGNNKILLVGAKDKNINIEKITESSLPEGLSYDKNKNH